MRQAVPSQVKAAARVAIKPILELFWEAEVRAKWEREKGESRRISAEAREIDGCGGHDRRDLCTSWGVGSDLRVPMVECQQCQHEVVCHFRMREKYHRFGMDLDQPLLFGSGCAQRVRHIQEDWSARVQGKVGRRTRNERINPVELLAQAARTKRLSDVPPVVQLDGMWVTIQRSQEVIKPEKRKRQRSKRSGKKQVILVALGFWPGGRWELLEWQIAEREDHQQWEVLVQRLWEHGCGPENGLQLVVRDGSGE